MNFYETLKAEIKLIFSDTAVVLTIFAGVILYAFLYPQPYLQKVTSQLSVYVVDLDKSSLSKELRFSLDASSQLNIIKNSLSIQDAQEALHSGKIMGFIVIPKNFKKDLILNKRPTIYLAADASYFLVYGSIIKSAVTTVLTLSEKVKVKKHLMKEIILIEAIEKSRSYTLQTQELFNPQVSYLQYVVPAVFILILQQTLLIGMGIIGGGENERRNKGVEIEQTSAQLWQKILARLLLFVSIYFIYILFYFGFIFEFYAITHIADMLDLLNFSIVYLLAITSFGLFFGSLLSTREMATPIVLFSSLPLVFSAGFVWPIESLPLIIQIVSIFIPTTPGIQGFLHLNQMGAGLNDVMLQYSLLVLQSLFYLSLSVYILKKKSHDF